MHWPQAIVDGRTLNEDEYPTYVDTWKSMEKLLETGKVKSIGISNFSIKTLEKLLPECKVIPVTNQVQLHPCLPQYELKKYCEDKGILLTAYSPIGAFNPAFFTDPDFARLARRNKLLPLRFALSWGVQRGTPVIPKSANIERMTQNLTLINLTEEDMEIVNSIHRKPGMHKSLLNAYFSDGVVFGWTYEQLGWDMDKNGVVKST
ncbi:hypothetical protein QCA50_005053 [Cerrena zonata]|uniref:NADP-dependent oxidoreductase domain-containing protein n=1 Tax=Cerrena zonata TaxID=2478898 RepID=A0AAW0GKI2_9APHY